MKKCMRRYRNHLYNHPLLTKGAAHGKSRKAMRRQCKVQLKKSIYPRADL